MPTKALPRPSLSIFSFRAPAKYFNFYGLRQLRCLSLYSLFLSFAFQCKLVDPLSRPDSRIIHFFFLGERYQKNEYQFSTVKTIDIKGITMGLDG